MERVIIKINQDWIFSLGDKIGENTEQVCLPHCVELTPAISSGGRNYQGKCSYQKTICMSEADRDKKHFIEFEGAMGVSELFVNGKLIKTHLSGYIPLVADITDDLVYGGENVVLIVIDNSDNEDVPPGKAQADLDFTYEGGLYRDVRLITTNRLYITHALLANHVAGGGVFVSYHSVTESNAVVHVKVNVRNETDTGKKFEARLTVRDKDGKTIASGNASTTLDKNADCHIEADLQVTSPTLWEVDNPYLYSLLVEVVSENELFDSQEVSIGIRTFEMTYDNGLIFNGKPCRLSGANYHQMFPYIGSAVPNSLLRRDALKLREIGMKTIRSHYPFATAFTDACNELGMALIVSNPGWQWYKDGVFAERACQNMRDIIRWQRNNPSIILWEPILNESYMPDEFQQRVHDIVHEEYPYSPCYTASDHGLTDVSYHEFDPDMLSPNGESYSDGATKHIPHPVWIREYNDSPDNWTDQNCAWRVPRGFGDYPMMRSVERMVGLDPQCDTNNYINIFNKERLCGYNIWPGIEHNRGYHINPCWGGHFDLFRVPKFSSYFMKSQLDIAEVGVQLYIANWWTEMSPDDVTVFSNADSVRLYHDDELVGEEKPMDLKVKNPPFLFKNVHTKFKKRERSIIKAEALVNGTVVATDVRQSPGVPYALKLEADFMDIPLTADGADIVMLTCKIVDELGNLVPMTGDRHPILFTATGEGKIIGDIAIGANPVCAEAGIATIMVQATKQSGEITVEADMFWKQKNVRAAIKSDKITFRSI